MKIWSLNKSEFENYLNISKDVILEELADDGFLIGEEAAYVSKCYVVSLLQPSKISSIWFKFMKDKDKDVTKIGVLKSTNKFIHKIDSEANIDPTPIPEDYEEVDPHPSLLGKVNLEIPDEVILFANKLIEEHMCPEYDRAEILPEKDEGLWAITLYKQQNEDLKRVIVRFDGKVKREDQEQGETQ